MKTLKSFAAVILLILSSFSVTAQKPDVIFVPTREPVRDAMLKLAAVDSSDVVYDLGCGDGRIVISAAKKFGARGVGIDIDPERIKEANQKAAEAGVTDMVEFKIGDLFESDFSEASVVTLYLLSRLNERLRPLLLEQLKPGTRVVSHSFGMGDWEPEETVAVDGTRIHLWIIPEKIEN